MITVLAGATLAHALMTAIVLAAAKCYFTYSEGDRPTRMALLLLVFSHTGFAALAFRNGLFQSLPQVVAGIALMLAAMALFLLTRGYLARRNLKLAAAGASDAASRLITGGPFSVVRHPFYSSYLGWIISTALMVTSWPVWLLSIMLCVLYYRIALDEENKIMDSPLRERYMIWRQHTGMFLPALCRRYK